MKTLHKGIWFGGTPEIGELYEKAHGGKVIGGVPVGYGFHIEVFVSVDTKLLQAKEKLISSINPEASRRFDAIEYKKVRALEQPDVYSIPEMLKERQDLRDASNKAKADIALLTMIEEVAGFSW